LRTGKKRAASAFLLRRRCLGGACATAKNGPYSVRRIPGLGTHHMPKSEWTVRTLTCGQSSPCTFRTGTGSCVDRYNLDLGTPALFQRCRPLAQHRELRCKAAGLGHPRSTGIGRFCPSLITPALLTTEVSRGVIVRRGTGHVTRLPPLMTFHQGAIMHLPRSGRPADVGRLPNVGVGEAVDVGSDRTEQATIALAR